MGRSCCYPLKAILVFIIAIIHGPVSAAIQQPILKWQQGGCTSWCQTGWYSSPAVADLDGNGTKEIIAASYSLFVLKGTDGSSVTSIDPEGGRSWPGVVIADIDNDNDQEIITAHGSGYVHAFDHNLGSIWSKRPTTNELRGLSVADLDNDNTMEVVVTAAVGSKTNTWVYEHDGSLRSGWPQLDNNSGYGYGVFNDNAAIADIDGNGQLDIVVPSDVHYICAYDPSGVQLAANTTVYPGRETWGLVGIWESPVIEVRGWGHCNGVRDESYRTNFAHGAAAIADLDGDATLEIVVTGNVYDCSVGHPPGKYNGVYILNSDRTRYNRGGNNWQYPPVDTGPPLSEDYNVIQNNQPNPAIADLDGDGQKEIIYSSYDGRVHAFWLDKTEHGSWPYSVYNESEGVYRFGSEPVVADLDNDGFAEVIVASWVEMGTDKTGMLHIIDHQGELVWAVDLPAAFGTTPPDWNGALAAPTLADIDGDADLEVVLNTAHSGFVAYDLPGTEQARVLWGTGRGSYLRNGTVPVLKGDLTGNFQVGLEDVIAALKIAAGMIAEDLLQLAAEINGDGRIGIGEAIYGLEELSGLP